MITVSLPPTPPARIATRELTIDNRRVAVIVGSSAPPPATACLARTASLSVTVRVSTIGGVNVIRARVRDARVYLDRGVPHIRHVLREGRRQTVVTYTPNATVHRLPGHRTLRLARRSSGRHVLRITTDATQSVHRAGRRESHPISRTVRIRFRVC